MMIQDSLSATAMQDASLRFSGEITVGDVVTALSVLISAAAIWITWRKDIHLRETEYADHVKTAAASTLAKLERAREITLYFFDLLGLSFLPANEMMAKGADRGAINDFIWKEAQKAAAECAKRLVEEEIELAYVDLYAYDEDFYRIFVDAREEQHRIWQRVVNETKRMTQDDILNPGASTEGLTADLRETCSVLAREMRDEIDGVLIPLRARLKNWIRADPGDIVNHKVDLSATQPDIPETALKVEDKYGRTVQAFVRGAIHARQPERQWEIELAYGRLYALIERRGRRGHRLAVAAARLDSRPTSVARQEYFARILDPLRTEEDPKIHREIVRILGASGDAVTERPATVAAGTGTAG